MSEEINIPEKSQTLITDIEDCYRDGLRYIQRFKFSLRRGIGNHDLYWFKFIGQFEVLFTLTNVDSNIQKEVVMNNTFTSVDSDMQKEVLKNGSGGLLVDYVSEWLQNGNNNRARGEKLFLAYRKILFKRNILSFKKQK